jgi:Transposase domain (DUF772)
MKQLTLAAVGFERYAKTTRRAGFLAEVERVVPWSALCAVIEPFYPKPGNGRPPVGVERMLRIYFLQQWFNLSDRAVEEALGIDRVELRHRNHISSEGMPYKAPNGTTAASSPPLAFSGDRDPLLRGSQVRSRLPAGGEWIRTTSTAFHH